jgi:membrane protease YdiL (CAAX protease family)
MGVDVDLILFSTLLTLLLALLAGMLAIWVWTLSRFWRGLPILADVPCFPLPPASWGAPTVFSLIFLYLLVDVTVIHGYSQLTGRRPARDAEARRREQGGRQPGMLEPRGDTDEAKQAEAESPVPGREAIDPAAPEQPDGPAVQTQTDMLIQLAVINGVLVVLVPLLLRFTARARLADFGLTLVDWRRQVAVGAAAALLMTPAVHAVQGLAVRVWGYQKHPVEQMVLGDFSPGIALLAVVSTVVLAPLVEELLFRGIVQRWLVRLAGEPREARSRANPGGLTDLGPEMLSPSRDPFDPRATMEDATGSAYRASLLQESVGPAPAPGLPILLTSLGFAALHAAQWPAPIAIFLLSMAIGVLYHQTGSLLAAITMHAMFNGFSTLLLLLSALSQQI